MPISSEYWQRLTTDERSRAVRFKHADDRVRFVITRVTLKYLLAEILDMSISKVMLAENDFGKPVLGDQLMSRNYLQFNVAHSGNKALIAFSNQGLVGTDIEKLNSVEKESKNLQSYIYSDEELGQPLDEYSLNRMSLSQTWVMKEAVLKAAGCGLYHNMTSFSLIQSVQDKSKFMVKDVPLAWSDTLIWFFDCDKDYGAAIAVMSK